MEAISYLLQLSIFTKFHHLEFVYFKTHCLYFKSFQNLFTHLSNNYAFSSNKTKNRKIEKVSEQKKRKTQHWADPRPAQPSTSPTPSQLPLSLWHLGPHVRFVPNLPSDSPARTCPRPHSPSHPPVPQRPRKSLPLKALTPPSLSPIFPFKIAARLHEFQRWSSEHPTASDEVSGGIRRPCFPSLLLELSHALARLPDIICRASVHQVTIPDVNGTRLRPDGSPAMISGKARTPPRCPSCHQPRRDAPRIVRYLLVDLDHRSFTVDHTPNRAHVVDDLTLAPVSSFSPSSLLSIRSRSHSRD
jgi:hypothetical protein